MARVLIFHEIQAYAGEARVGRYLHELPCGISFSTTLQQATQAFGPSVAHFNPGGMWMHVWDGVGKEQAPIGLRFLPRDHGVDFFWLQGRRKKPLKAPGR